MRHTSIRRRAIRACLGLVLATLAAACGDAAPPGTQPVLAASSGGTPAVPSVGSAAAPVSVPPSAAMGGSAGTSQSAGAAAAGSGGTTTASAAAAGGGAAGAPTAAGPVTFSRVWAEVLFPKGCAGAYCHGAGQGNLKFTSKEQAHAALVGVPAAGMACGASGKQRVKPGDPAASLLLEKLEQSKPSCGDPMPIGTKVEPGCVSMSQPVCNTQAELTLIRQWIAAGARND